MKSVKSLVRGVLARHVGRPALSIKAMNHLDRDLDVTPLELALVAMEIEDVVGLPLPADGLAAIETVGDLISFVTKAMGASGLERVA